MTTGLIMKQFQLGSSLFLSTNYQASQRLESSVTPHY